jgi:hypothetical protein
MNRLNVRTSQASSISSSSIDTRPERHTFPIGAGWHGEFSCCYPCVLFACCVSGFRVHCSCFLPICVELNVFHLQSAASLPDLSRKVSKAYKGSYNARTAHANPSQMPVSQEAITLDVGNSKAETEVEKPTLTQSRRK